MFVGFINDLIYNILIYISPLIKVGSNSWQSCCLLLLYPVR